MECGNPVVATPAVFERSQVEMPKSLPSYHVLFEEPRQKVSIQSIYMECTSSNPVVAALGVFQKSGNSFWYSLDSRGYL